MASFSSARNTDRRDKEERSPGILGGLMYCLRLEDIGHQDNSTNAMLKLLNGGEALFKSRAWVMVVAGFKNGKPIKKSWQKYLTGLLVFCSFFYPLIGFVLGHYYPKACTFGVMPCPTTVFALALLVAALPEVDKKVYLLLLAWALAAFGKCLGALDLYEDCILFWTGIYALVMLLKNWKRTTF